MNLFVYGTLKQKNINHGYLRNSKFLGKAALPHYKLYNIGGIPTVVKGGDGVVHGELYSVCHADLTLINKLESAYKQVIEEVMLMTPNGCKMVKAILYSFMSASENWHEIESGQWQ